MNFTLFLSRVLAKKSPVIILSRTNLIQERYIFLLAEYIFLKYLGGIDTLFHGGYAWFMTLFHAIYNDWPCNVFIIWSWLWVICRLHTFFLDENVVNVVNGIKDQASLILLCRVFIAINVINVLISYAVCDVSVLTTKSVRTFMTLMTFMTLSYDFYDV